VATGTTIEQVRAQLVPASDLYALRNRPDSRLHLETARGRYGALSRRVAARDAVLDREIRVAFDRIGRQIAAGENVDFVRMRLSLLQGQLLDAVYELLVPKAARDDPGVRARTVLVLLGELELSYRGATPPPGRGRGALAFQTAYGELARSQLVARSLGGALGDRKEGVLEDFSRLREQAFPRGVARPPVLLPPPRVDAGVARIRRAIRATFRF
jgi:hypothetical protein